MTTRTDPKTLHIDTLRRLIAYLDERLSSLQHLPKQYAKTEREYKEAMAELTRRTS